MTVVAVVTGNEGTPPGDIYCEYYATSLSIKVYYAVVHGTLAVLDG